MKKHFIHILLAASVLMTGVSCAKVLDATPDGRLTEDDIFADADLTADYFSTLFNFIPRGGNRSTYFWSNAWVFMADEAWDCDAGSEGSISSTDMYTGQATAASHPMDTKYPSNGFDRDYWTRYFGQLRLINTFLSRIDDPETAVDNENTRRLWKAEAKVLRAFFSLQLMKIYGAIPDPRNLYSLEYDYTELRKLSWKECADIVVEDCNDALKEDLLPWKLSDDNERNRMTKGIACAIKSQTALFAASPLFCGGNNYWDWAYQINKESFDELCAHGYALDTFVPANDAVLFDNPYHWLNNQVHTLALTEEDTEIIWREWDSSSPSTDICTINGNPLMGTYKAGQVPTQELIDAFDVLSTGKPVLDLRKPYNDDRHLSPNFNTASGYTADKDMRDPYTDRDPRLMAIAYYNGSVLYDRDGNRNRVFDIYTGSLSDRRPWGGNRNHTRTGYYMRKRCQPLSEWLGQGDGTHKAAPVVYFRLGEVYLNLAECAVESGKVAEGIALVNEIRHRAGFSPSVDIVCSDKDLGRLYVWHERQVELCMDGTRYFDERRWLLPDNDETGERHDIESARYLTGVDCVKNNDGSFTYTRVALTADTPDASRACWTYKYKFLPIPQSEANRLKALTGEEWQNPGW